jgi:hypothetical protein
MNLILVTYGLFNDSVNSSDYICQIIRLLLNNELGRI